MKAKQISNARDAAKAIVLCEQNLAQVIRPPSTDGQGWLLLVSKSRTSEIRIAAKYTSLFEKFLAEKQTVDERRRLITKLTK